MRMQKFGLVSVLALAAVAARAEDPDTVAEGMAHSKEYEEVDSSNKKAPVVIQKFDGQDAYEREKAAAAKVIEQALAKFQKSGRKVSHVAGNFVFHDQGQRWVRVARNPGCTPVKPETICGWLNESDPKGKWIPASKEQLQSHKKFIAEIDEVYSAVAAERMVSFARALSLMAKVMPTPKQLAAMQNFYDEPRDFCFIPRPTGAASEGSSQKAVATEKFRKQMNLNSELGFPQGDQSPVLYCVSQQQ